MDIPLITSICLVVVIVLVVCPILICLYCRVRRLTKVVHNLEQGGMCLESVRDSVGCKSDTVSVRYVVNERDAHTLTRLDTAASVVIMPTPDPQRRSFHHTGEQMENMDMHEDRLAVPGMSSNDACICNEGETERTSPDDARDSGLDLSEHRESRLMTMAIEMHGHESEPEERNHEDARRLAFSNQAFSPDDSQTGCGCHEDESLVAQNESAVNGEESEEPENIYDLPPEEEGDVYDLPASEEQEEDVIYMNTGKWREEFLAEIGVESQ